MALQPDMLKLSMKAITSRATAEWSLVDDIVSDFNRHLFPSVYVVGNNKVFLVGRVGDSQTGDDDIACCGLAMNHQFKRREILAGVDLLGRFGRELDENE